jgi:hypothetical protein
VASAPGHAQTVLAHVFDQLDDDEVALLGRVMGKIVLTVDPADRFGALRDDHPAVPRTSRAVPQEEPVAQAADAPR